jgi:hypothetical protein
MQAPSPSRITLRCVLLGAILVTFVGLITPYNDYVVYNTLTTGGFFPPAVVLTLFVLVLLVNAPLHKLAPRHAFSTTELTVILGMMLVGCAVPGQGMMRALLPTMVSPFHFARGMPEFEQAFGSAGLSQWLFPVDKSDFLFSRVVTEFYGRTPADASPPYAAWILPFLVWSVFIAGVYMTLLSIASLLRTQWAHNERLSFPLAQLEVALIESPRPGHAFNELLASKSFWIALAFVFAIHLTNGLSIYFPRYVPAIPLTFNLRSVLTQEPWLYLIDGIKVATLYFTAVGVMYFIPGRVGFSLFFVYLFLQLISITSQTAFQYTISETVWMDQHLGAAVTFLLSIAWIGRKHWATVTRHVFAGTRPGESVSHRAPALFLLAGISIMAAWLMFFGVSAWMTALIIACMLLAHLVVARIVAETGIPIYRTTLTPVQVFTALPAGFMTGKDVFFGGTFGIVAGAFNTRESSLAMSLHAHRIADEIQPGSRWRLKFSLLLVLALTLAYFSSAASGLYCYYNYATPISSRVQQPVLNDHLLLAMPLNEIVNPMVQHKQGAFTAKAHNPLLHFSIGAIVMAALQLGAWASASFPLVPIGYLTGTTWYMRLLWWSVFVGWLLKTLIVRFGGAPLYRAARPFFVGLIFGECLGATFWLLVSFTLASLGFDYIEIRLLPT